MPSAAHGFAPSTSCSQKNIVVKNVGGEIGASPSKNAASPVRTARANSRTLPRSTSS